MPNESGAEVPATPPDADRVPNARLGDGGPIYIETPRDPFAPDAPLIAEPWNAITATFFILIAVAWFWRLRGRYREFPFLVSALPVLLAGGIGGTLYHAFRTSRLYFLLDVIPISLLGIAGAVFMAYRYFGRQRAWVLIAFLAAYSVLSRAAFTLIPQSNRQLAINLSYASLALVVLTPIALILIRMRFRHAGWVVAGVISFAIAWFCRLYDQYSADYLRMGSHWLWHTFGAISTMMLIQFFYKIEGDKSAGAPRPRENLAN
jgi:hypothetical protein